MKILIADDELHNRMLLQKILSPYGECDAVVNGKEVVDIFELALQDADPYDLVCLDIMMPEMDGQEALERLRAVEKEMGVDPDDESTIVMVTALDSPKTVINAFYRGGCTDYLPKPITPDRVLNKLREHGLIS